MRRWAIWIVSATVIWLGAGTLHGAAHNEGAELVGTKAKHWKVSTWFNSPPLRLSQLHGRVVLVRWWTGPECPYCAASAPNLNALYETYRAKGLMVIGFYHHKSPTPLMRRHVEQLVKQYQFQFPVAVDPEWRTLKRWWLDGHEHAWTSVSFLIDREGIIRDIHPGGSYSKEDVREMEAIIQQLLASPQRGGAS